MSPPTSMSSSILVVGALLLGAARAGTPATCSNPQLSCSASASASCCFIAPGGQLLQTQFWDTDPETGPTNSWTIHGLWPDNCDGTFSEDCDSSRAYTGISGILQDRGEDDLLDYLNTYWRTNSGSDETFWEHEWETHGTCINTLDTDCYTNYEKYDELIDFINVMVTLFKANPTYETLTNAGITPSSSKTYTSSAIQAALKAAHGQEVTLGCDNSELYQVYYHYHVKGSLQTGTFQAAAPVGSSSCPSSGIKWLPKTSGTAVPTTSTATKTTSTKTTTTTPTSTGVFSGKGFLNVQQSGSTNGCLISAGTWFVSGTCATYTATASGSGFTLSSSKGTCGVVSGQFECGSGVSATTFTAVDGLLAVSGSTNFYATEVAAGQTQVAVFTSSSSSHSTEVQITFGST